MSTVEQPEDPSVRLCRREEALKRARPLPPRKQLVLDPPDEEWTAFERALAGV